LDNSLLRKTVKVVIGENLGRQWCPGEENCSKYVSARDKETVCNKCPRNLSKSSLSQIEGVQAALPWLSHLFYLDSLRRVGAVFHLNDLSREEWDGLILLENVRAELEQEMYDKEKRKSDLGTAMARQSQVRK